MLEHEIASKNIKRVKASIGGPEICHVMYADDIVLFSKATRRDAAKINDCIEKYCNWSKQKLNINNYGFFFSKYTHNQPRRFIKQVLQMKGLKQDSIYLGAPLFLSRALSKVACSATDCHQYYRTSPPDLEVHHRCLARQMAVFSENRS